MCFNQVIFSAVLIGLVVGLVDSGFQMMGVTAIIYEAENYEIPEIAGSAEEAWEPASDLERMAYTFLANVLSAIGFAAILLALMNQVQQQGLTQLSTAKGVLWGLAGFIAFFMAPGLGLSPEIPGTQAAALESRQLWWVLMVLASIIGLAVLAFSPLKYKVIGVVILVTPFLIGAPHIDGPEFVHPDALAVEVLNQLHHQFIIATGISNLVFWLLLGVACAWAMTRVSDVSCRND